MSVKNLKRYNDKSFSYKHSIYRKYFTPPAYRLPTTNVGDQCERQFGNVLN